MNMSILRNVISSVPGDSCENPSHTTESCSVISLRTMPRTSSRSHLPHIGVGFLAAILMAGCSSGPVLIDQRPPMAADEELDSTIWIGLSSKGRLTNAASAVVIGPDHLLTNRHCAPASEPWWSSNAVDCPNIWFNVVTEGTSSLQRRASTVEAFGQVPESIATRTPDEIYTNSDLLNQINDADWVTLKIDDPPWSPESIAIIHEPALDPNWTPPAGTPLFILGYSPVFLDPDGFEKVNPFSSRYRSFINDGPYAIAGPALTADSIPAIDYELGLPKPEGQSGGGVYLWNADSDRLELIGITQGLGHLIDGEISKIHEDWTGDLDRLGIFCLYVPIGKVLSP